LTILTYLLASFAVLVSSRRRYIHQDPWCIHYYCPQYHSKQATLHLPCGWCRFTWSPCHKSPGLHGKGVNAHMPLWIAPYP